MGQIRNRTDAFAERLAETMIARKWSVIVLGLVFAALCFGIMGASFASERTSFATNYRVFFGPNNPELKAFEDFQNTYTRTDNILVVIQPPEGPSRDGVFNRETLDIVERYTLEAWQTPHVIRVDSISNFQHTYADGEDLIVEDLVENASTLTDQDLARIRDIALNEPLLRNQLVTPDGGLTAINIVLQYPEIELDEVPQAANFARESLRDAILAEQPDYRIALTGLSMLNNSFAESGMIDAGTLMPAMLGVVALVMLIALRSVSGTVATMTIVLMSIFATMAAAGVMAIKLTPISMAAPIIVLTLAIADSIHVLMSARTAMREGKTKREAIVDAVRINFLAIFITSLTTIVGFLALNFSDAPPFGHLGNMAAVGIAVAFVLSVTLLPALLAVLPLKVRAGSRDVGSDLMERFGDWVVRHNRALMVGSGVAALGMVALMPRIEFNDQWTQYFDERVEIRQDNDFALQHFGLFAVEFSIDSGETGGVSEPAFLAKLEEFSNFLREQEGVVHVYSLTDIMKRLNKNLNGDDPSFFRLPEDRELAAQYLLLYELSLPYGLDLNDRINIDKTTTRLTATLGDATTAETKAFEEAAKAWIEENAPESWRTQTAHQSTGPSIMFAYVADRNVASMIQGTLIAITAIALIMIVALRDLKLGLLSLIPNGLPIAVSFGAWAVLVGTVGFSVAAVAAVSLGIVVDDTVHFLTKYQRGMRERGLSAEDAIRYAFKSVGAALFVNTVILSIGFAVLATSTFKLNGDLGLLTAMSIIFALVLDFLLLPGLLLLIDGKKTGASTQSLKGDDHVQTNPA